MSSNDNMNLSDTKHSEPISIPTNARGRARSMSVSSASSASTSSSELPTPPSGSANSARFTVPSPSSPILSYFLAQSPTTKTPATAFPFKRKFGTTPVFEGASYLHNSIRSICLQSPLYFAADEDTDAEIPVAAHARRASAQAANRFSQNPPPAFPDVNADRGTNLLRRLSLSSSAFVKPQLDPVNTRTASPPSPPPNTAVSPTSKTAPFINKPRRSATISNEGGRPRRAPSPMGERILKGHFDGFN
ncbi:hypothetical protein JR316_0005848 [Psilocybe cubensis]|uniref:Uncharacterized protein n=2 Tax=Psilocybe cubensis TaxID=181762 RepID=A0A8H8CMJ1_PSICU|nr:hypothetical protein JR316_0005848 [Psilocybe cubensis]KAH9481326.1 hypothetical protein JR316_0005848 [Psilocybe cubensis]